MSRKIVMIVSLISLLIAFVLCVFFFSFFPYRVAILLCWALLTCILLDISRRRSASLSEGEGSKKLEPYTIQQSLTKLEINGRQKQKYDGK
ncbi:hypothetical protein [Ktedonobacter sp. SOSP1-85]|uniref:hypothetical protein n=1 Tax=Ktedonobacter sp. SOSP1-85 TaxID=2778367 RepID=UPI0019151961|nr:hypothetical protein [Ktedonobacter sp. SOSP1-85]